MDLNNWWVVAFVLFVLFSASGGNGQVNDTRSLNDEDDDDPNQLIQEQQVEDQLRQEWEERQRENWGAHDD